jgi:hypothetical protein
MDFLVYADENGKIVNPYAAKFDGKWLAGTIDVSWLSEHFGHCESFDECIQATESEGLKLFFEHLKAQL